MQTMTLFALGVLLIIIGLAEAQPSAKVPRIGYVSGTGSATVQGPYVEPLRQGLRELGHVEGRTFTIEYRGAEGRLDQLPTILKELAQSVDLIVAPFTGAVRAARQATTTVPIVMVTGTDPVANGWISSLGRPAGNVTGIFTLAQDLNGKRLELMTELVPGSKRVAVLWARNDQASADHYKEYEAAARDLKVQLQSVQVDRGEPDVADAFQTAVNGRATGVITITTAALFLKQKTIAALGIKHRLATMFQGSTWVDAGGLMSYATDEFDAIRRAARFVDKILKGAKPSDLPVEQSSKYEMVINLNTAKQIGLSIPPIVMARADRVIR